MKTQTSIRVDDKFFEESKEVFSKLGLSFTEAVNIFLAKVAMDKKIPFELGIEPSDELKKRAKNIEDKKNIQTFKNSSELFDELGI